MALDLNPSQSSIIAVGDVEADGDIMMRSVVDDIFQADGKVAHPCRSEVPDPRSELAAKAGSLRWRQLETGQASGTSVGGDKDIAGSQIQFHFAIPNFDQYSS